MFKDGFKIEVFTELIYHNTIIKNLDDLIKITIKINNKLYRLQIMTRPSKTNKYYHSYSARHYIIKKNYESFSTQYENLIDLNII